MKHTRNAKRVATAPPLSSSTQATLSYQKPYDAMTPEEILVWLGDLHARLQAKQQRERAYLDRRAARGIHTPTDDAYAHDQALETELLSMLAGMQDELRKQVQP